MASVETQIWRIHVDHAALLDATADWQEILRVARARAHGHLSAKRVGATDELSFYFNESRGILEYSQGEQILHPVFPHRPLAPEETEEFYCSGCGIPLEFPRRRTISRDDAFAIFWAFLQAGELPVQVPERSMVHKQLFLPGVEEFLVPDVEWRAVEWRSG